MSTLLVILFMAAFVVSMVFVHEDGRRVGYERAVAEADRRRRSIQRAGARTIDRMQEPN